MHSPKLAACLVAAAFAVLSAAHAQSPDPDSPPESPPALPPGIVARVDGISITQSSVDDLLWREWGPVHMNYAIRSKIVRMEAEQRGITITPEELQARMRDYQAMFSSLPGRQPRDWELFILRYGREGVEDRQRDEILAEKIGEDEAFKTTLNEAERDRIRTDLERAAHKVRARHILIGVGDGYGGRTEQQALARAEEVRVRLFEGLDWDAAALEYSDDVSTREHGGDLGFFTRDQMVRPLEAAAFSAKPGDAPSVIRVPEGVDVFQVLERTDDPPTEEKVQSAMDEALKRKKEIARTVEAWYPEVERKYKVVMLPPYERKPEAVSPGPAKPSAGSGAQPAARPPKKPPARPTVRPAR